MTSTSDLNWAISNVQKVEKDFADNSAPVFTSPETGSFLVTDGQTLEFDVAATDADPGDTVILQAENVPEGANFNPQSGHFSWTPTEADTGHSDVIAFQAAAAHPAKPTPPPPTRASSEKSRPPRMIQMKKWAC